MANLTVRFRDIEGYYYTARVSNLDSAMRLPAAASPFVVEEDDSEDPMTPIRISTGYLTVKTDRDADVSAIMPTTDHNRKVVLTKSSSLAGTGTVVWSGYVQAQSFANTFLRYGDDVQIPIHSQLASLECIYPEYDWNDTPTFVDIIRQMLKANGYNSFSTVYFATSTSFKTNLRQRFCWDLLFDFNEDRETEAKYNCLQVLEEICRFWGFTVREQGDAIVFQSVDEKYDGKISYMTWAEFEKFANGQTYTSSEYDSYTQHNIYSGYCNLDQAISVMQGVKKVVVESDPNTVSTVLELNCQDLMDKWKGNTVQKSGNDDDGYYFQLRGTYDHAYPSDTVVQYDGWTVTLHETGDQDRETQEQINYCYFYAFEIYKKKLEFKHNYDFEYWFELEGSCTSKYLLEAISKYQMALANCCIVIDADVMYFSRNIEDIRNANNIILECQLRVGQMYWNGSSWSSTASTFNIEGGYDDDESGGVGKIKCNRELSSVYDSYTGHGIPIGGALAGIVCFRIVKAYRQIGDTINWYPLMLRNLRITVANKLSSTVKSYRSKNRYFDIAGVFEKDYNINTIFCTSNNNEWGTGLLLDSLRGISSGATYYTPSGVYREVPEKELLRRVKAYRNMTRKIFDLSLNYDDFSAFNIFDDWYVYSASTLCAMLSYKYDFAENILKLKLIER